MTQSAATAPRSAVQPLPRIASISFFGRSRATARAIRSSHCRFSASGVAPCDETKPPPVSPPRQRASSSAGRASDASSSGSGGGGAGSEAGVKG